MDVEGLPGGDHLMIMDADTGLLASPRLAQPSGGSSVGRRETDLRGPVEGDPGEIAK